MREYTFDEEVTLVASDPDTGKVTKRRSYAEIVSVRGDETYKFMAIGLKPELLVVLPSWMDDYHGEETLEYSGLTYRVLRVFKTQDLRAELTVYRPIVNVYDSDTFCKGELMDIDALIQEAIKPIVPICVPDIYEGDKDEYCVYNYIEEPMDSGDDLPVTIRYIVAIHWIFPWAPFVTASADVKDKKLRIKRALAAADFTYPLVRPASDDQAGHLIFEAVIVGGEV